MDGTIEIEECEEPTCDNLNSDEQFLRSQDANFETAEGNVPLEEMLAVISESKAATRNLQSLVQASPCTNHQNSTNTSNSVESKTKPEALIISTQDEVGSSSASGATTTNLICYDKYFRPLTVSVVHRDSIKPEVNVEKCHNVVVGDKAEVNICRNNGLLNQNEKPESTYVRSNETEYPLLQTDGVTGNAVNISRRKKHGKRPSQRNSGKKSTSKEKIKTEWYFPMFLSDFTDSESLEKDIDQWLKELVSSLLREAQDCLEDFDSVIKLLEEAGERVRESSIPNCIEKLNEAICYLMDTDGSKKYKILLTETHFALAEFYIMKEDYLGALQCLKALERDLTPCGEEFETQISRLYAKMAKVMELCLEFSQDFTIYENEFEVASKTQASNRNPDEDVLSYFQKALDFSKNEPLVVKRELEEIQRSCYLGKAAVLLKCYKGQNETVRNLTEVRQNLTSTEKLFDRISPAMKCQFYLIEAFLLFYEGRYKMAADKAQMARNIADEENVLEKECLGSKRLRFLLEELDKVHRVKSTPCIEVSEDFLDLGSLEEQL